MMGMTPSLSRAAARAIQYLHGRVREPFVSAVSVCTSIDDVPEPYQGWILDPETIPIELRTKSYVSPSEHSAAFGKPRA